MKILIVGSLTALVLVGSASSQESEHKKRSVNQQERIAQGVKSGQMTSGEAARVEGREAGIKREVRADRATNGGPLTPTEKAAVNRQQGRVSNQIYDDKHNTSTAKYGSNQVGTRRQVQQDRVASGIASGKMSAGEAARTERRETAVNSKIKADRAVNGGKLTAAERARVNRQQNGTSKQIYTEKHNQ